MHSLAVRGRAETRGLSESHLLYAARTLPDAHLALSRVYTAQGATQVAETELKRYQEAAALKSQAVPVMGFLPRQ